MRKNLIGTGLLVHLLLYDLVGGKVHLITHTLRTESLMLVIARVCKNTLRRWSPHKVLIVIQSGWINCHLANCLLSIYTLFSGLDLTHFFQQDHVLIFDLKFSLYKIFAC